MGIATVKLANYPLELLENVSALWGISFIIMPMELTFLKLELL